MVTPNQKNEPEPEPNPQPLAPESSSFGRGLFTSGLSTQETCAEPQNTHDAPLVKQTS